MTRRQKKLEKAIVDCLETVNSLKPSRNELVTVLAQLLIRSGYSVHWGYENPETERPDQISQEMADKLYDKNMSIGTTMMKIGFDLQEAILLK